MQKIGIGYDIHRFIEGKQLSIGGLQIPYLKGLHGHSDGDVLLHAVCDALLGAVGAGDIGEHFPDTDPDYQDISSAELLKKVCSIVKEKGFAVSNVDTVIVAQEPNFSPFKKKMQSNISEIIGIPQDCVNVKAKTNNSVGEIGRKEAIASYAVVLVNKGV